MCGVFSMNNIVGSRKVGFTAEVCEGSRTGKTMEAITSLKATTSTATAKRYT